jgi:hypothetical protein
VDTSAESRMANGELRIGGRFMLLNAIVLSSER